MKIKDNNTLKAFKLIYERFGCDITKSLKEFINKQDCEELSNTSGLCELIDMFLSENNDIDPDTLCYEIASSYMCELGYNKTKEQDCCIICDDLEPSTESSELDIFIYNCQYNANNAPTQITMCGKTLVITNKHEKFSDINMWIVDAINENREDLSVITNDASAEQSIGNYQINEFVTYCNEVVDSINTDEVELLKLYNRKVRLSICGNIIYFEFDAVIFNLIIDVLMEVK